MSLSNRLKNKIDVYGRIQIKNELDEIDFDYRKIKSIWAEVTPQSGRNISGNGNTVYAEISHKFTIRSNALKEISNDMYFIFKEQRYDIKYYNPNYKYRDSIDVFCILEVENN